MPSAAVRTGRTGFFVYVVGADDMVEARPIKTGQIADGRAVIKRARRWRAVVSRGQYRIEPGARISAASGGPRSRQ